MNERFDFIRVFEFRRKRDPVSVACRARDVALYETVCRTAKTDSEKSTSAVGRATRVFPKTYTMIITYFSTIEPRSACFS